MIQRSDPGILTPFGGHPVVVRQEGWRGEGLSCPHRRFGPAAMRLAPPALQAHTCRSDLVEAIECVDIAGLCDAAKRNWYPVAVEDTVAAPRSWVWRQRR